LKERKKELFACPSLIDNYHTTHDAAMLTRTDRARTNTQTYIRDQKEILRSSMTSSSGEDHRSISSTTHWNFLNQ